MIIIYILLFAVLFGANWYVTKTIFYPPAMFAAWWGFCLFILAIMGKMFYSISYASLLIYFIGAFSFSVGGVLVLTNFQLSSNNAKLSRYIYPDRLVNKLINSILFLLIGIFPFYLKAITERAETASGTNFLIMARRATLTNQQVVGHAHLIDNVVIVAMVIALIAFYESRCFSRYKSRTILAIITALAYSLLSGAKSGPIFILLSLTGIYFIYTRRLNLRGLLIITLPILFLFSVVTVSRIGYSNATNINEAIVHDLPKVGKNFMGYLLGGIVAFDRIANDSSSIRNNWHIYRYFTRIYSRFDPSIKVPSIHAEYTNISPDKNTNVYTLYFAYFPDFGIAGVVLIMMFLGAILTFTYKQAIFGDPVATIFYGVFTNAVVMSIFNELFFLGLNGYVKLYIFLYMFYRILPVLVKGTKKLPSKNHVSR